MNMNETIFINICSKLEKQGKSEEDFRQLLRKLGYDKGSVEQIFNGERGFGVTSLRCIADYLGVLPSDLTKVSET